MEYGGDNQFCENAASRNFDCVTEGVNMSSFETYPVNVDQKSKMRLWLRSLLCRKFRDPLKHLLNLLEFFCTLFLYSLDFENELYPLQSCHNAKESEIHDKMFVIKMNSVAISLNVHCSEDEQEKFVMRDFEEGMRSQIKLYPIQ